VHRSPDICLTAEENPRKPSMNAVQPVIVSNRVPYLQMRLIKSHSTSGMEKGRKEGKDRILGQYITTSVF
jgi:hypothetical protein